MTPESNNSLESIAKKAESLSSEIAETVEDKKELLGIYGQRLEDFLGNAYRLYKAGAETQKERVKAAVAPLVQTLERFGLQITQNFEKGADALSKQFGPLDRASFDQMLHSLDRDEFQCFLNGMERAELTPQQSMRLEQVALMKEMLLGLSEEFNKGGETWTLWAARLFVGSETEIKTSASFRRAAVDGMRKTATEIITNPEASLAQVAPKWIEFFAKPPSMVGWIMPPIQFKEVKTTKELNDVRAQTVAALREIKHYSEARVICKNVLNPYIEKAKVHVTYEEKKRALNHNMLLVYSEPNYSKLKAEALKSGVKEPAVNAYLNQIAEAITETEVTTMAASHIDETKLPAEVRAVWDQYKDMDDPTNEWGNLADETKDTIIEELCINGALLLASAAMGAGAGALAARAAAGLSTETLSFMRANARLATYLVEGSRSYEAISTLGRGLHAGIEMGTEALVSEFANQGLDMFGSEKTFNQVLSESPAWALNIMWNMVSMGIGKKAVGLAEKYPPGLMMGFAAKITNPGARKLAQELVVKGQTEAGVDLIVSCVREGAFEGDTKGVEDQFGDFLYSSYLMSNSGVAAGSYVEGLARAAI